MITGELKNRIDSLWNTFAAGGMVNPLDVIEQITYLMFIHDLDEADLRRAKESAMLGLKHESIFVGPVLMPDGQEIEAEPLRWSVFRDYSAEQMFEVVQSKVFPFIKSLHRDKKSAYSKYMEDAIFKLPTPLVLSDVVDALDGIYESMKSLQSADIRGDVYEYLLSKIAQSGRNGQFRTPRHIIRMMVDMMNPVPEDRICDPACGTSGFLLAAGIALKEPHPGLFMDKERRDHYMNQMFTGYDMDRTMLRIGAMNMMTHGVDNPVIEYRDSLSDQNPDADSFSLILANPPFKGSLNADIVAKSLARVCKTKKTELLFLALFLRMLKVGGRCACIVPDGVLFGSSAAHRAIRQTLVESHRLQAVISMPAGVFRPYAGVSTGILIFTKTGHGGTDQVWFYDMRADGFSLDDKRTPVSENDIPDIVQRFAHLEEEGERSRTDQSFFVPKEEIVANGYDLSINKYKKTEYKAVEYPPTKEILAELHELEGRIASGLKELEGML